MVRGYDWTGEVVWKGAFCGPRTSTPMTLREVAKGRGNGSANAGWTSTPVHTTSGRYLKCATVGSKFGQTTRRVRSQIPACDTL
jgi:hypothetical protein